jgi:hypothetical protein
VNFAQGIEAGLLLLNSTHTSALTILSLPHIQMPPVNPLTSFISKTTVEDLDACVVSMCTIK